MRHEDYMHRCLDLARLGGIAVAPNPMVGCVLVKNGKIIGEGYHQKFGAAHAEVNAIAAVQDASLLEGATAYVSLATARTLFQVPQGVTRVEIKLADLYASDAVALRISTTTRS